MAGQRDRGQQVRLDHFGYNVIREIRYPPSRKCYTGIVDKDIHSSEPPQRSACELLKILFT